MTIGICVRGVRGCAGRLSEAQYAGARSVKAPEPAKSEDEDGKAGLRHPAEVRMGQVTTGSRNRPLLHGASERGCAPLPLSFPHGGMESYYRLVHAMGDDHTHVSLIHGNCDAIQRSHINTLSM